MQALKASDAQLNRFGRGIEAIKERVPIEQVAQEYFEARLAGPNRLLARCPSPEHEDRTPSFTIFTDTQRFKCFGIGCGIAGDVVDLEKICGGHSQLWEAMVALAIRYGVALPNRSEKWCRWQSEKHAIERLGEDIRTQVRWRRLFKVVVLNAPEIQSIEDPAVRREEIRLCWQAFQEGMRKVGR
jgi:CHC2-type zinc finger protein